MKIFRNDTDLQIEEPKYFSKSYMLNEDSISGYVEGRDALAQTIWKTLHTQQYEYPIYSWDYGVQIQKLLGKERQYVKAELKRMITEALSRDDRVEDVGNFEFTFEGDTCKCSFTVYSIYGDINADTEVLI